MSGCLCKSLSDDWVHVFVLLRCLSVCVCPFLIYECLCMSFQDVCLCPYQMSVCLCMSCPDVWVSVYVLYKAMSVCKSRLDVWVSVYILSGYFCTSCTDVWVSVYVQAKCLYVLSRHLGVCVCPPPDGLVSVHVLPTCLCIACPDVFVSVYVPHQMAWCLCMFCPDVCIACPDILVFVFVLSVCLGVCVSKQILSKLYMYSLIWEYSAYICVRKAISRRRIWKIYRKKHYFDLSIVSEKKKNKIHKKMELVPCKHEPLRHENRPI